MSVKIYTAFRCPSACTNEAIDFWQKYLFNSSCETLNKVVAHLPELEQYKAAIKHVREWSKKEDGENGFNYLECSVNFYFHQNKVYMVPWRSGSWFLNIDSYPLFLEPFEYYNNTDKPQNISLKEWNKRKKIWNEILDHDERKLILNVVNIKDNYSRSLFLYKWNVKRSEKLNE